MSFLLAPLLYSHREGEDRIPQINTPEAKPTIDNEQVLQKRELFYDVTITYKSREQSKIVMGGSDA
jgi:hypothetical protein